MLNGDGSETLDVVLFRAGGVLFAVPAENAREAQHDRSRRRPALDLAVALGRRPAGNQILVVTAGRRRLCLRVDEVEEVTALPLETIHRLPSAAADSHRGGYVVGVAERGDELALMLDVGALVRAEAEIAPRGAPQRSQCASGAT